MKTQTVFSFITRALLRFHFTSSPGRLCMPSSLVVPGRTLLASSPGSLLNNAICHSPLSRPAPSYDLYS